MNRSLPPFFYFIYVKKKIDSIFGRGNVFFFYFFLVHFKLVRIMTYFMIRVILRVIIYFKSWWLSLLFHVYIHLIILWLIINVLFLWNSLLFIPKNRKKNLKETQNHSFAKYYTYLLCVCSVFCISSWWKMFRQNLFITFFFISLKKMNLWKHIVLQRFSPTILFIIQFCF